MTTITTSRYTHTQKGPLCLIFYFLAVGFIVLAWVIPDTAVFYIYGLAGLFTGLIVAPAFQHLKVLDLGDVLGIRFGPLPLFLRTVRYTDIGSVEVGRTSLSDGWGIHLSFRGGWVWNLWGRDCVVIHFEHGGTLRIGTNDAENLVAFLKERACV